MYLLRSNKDMSATAKVNGKIYFHEKYYIISSIKRSIDKCNQAASRASIIASYQNLSEYFCIFEKDEILSEKDEILSEYFCISEKDEILSEIDEILSEYFCIFEKDEILSEKDEILS